MNDSIKYKYLLIYNKNKKIIYGECIKWILGKYDKKDDFDFSFSLTNNHKARVITSSKRIETINNNEIKLYELSMDVSDFGEEFITQTHGETLFNPLIDRCSNITMYIDDEYHLSSIENITTTKKDLINKVKEEFEIDFFKKPELIGTFTIYEPTRIIVDSYFKDKRQNNDAPTELVVTFNDEFNMYSDCQYTINQYVDDEIKHSVSGSITHEVEPNSGLDLDELEIIIKNKTNSIVYQSRYGFLRSISVNGTVVSGKTTLEDGTSIDRVSQFSFKVGDKDD